ncbi:hypothetical protein H4219_003142, partial [Mycoemilia scoparia]
AIESIELSENLNSRLIEVGNDSSFSDDVSSSHSEGDLDSEEEEEEESARFLNKSSRSSTNGTRHRPRSGSTFFETAMGGTASVVYTNNNTKGSKSSRTNAETANKSTTFDAYPRVNGNNSMSSMANTFFPYHHSPYRENYIELYQLGRGGYGRVFEVKHRIDGHHYAVKIIPIRDPTKIEKTIRENKVLAQLCHPNIVRYHHSWVEQESPKSATATTSGNGQALERNKNRSTKSLGTGAMYITSVHSDNDDDSSDTNSSDGVDISNLSIGDGGSDSTRSIGEDSGAGLNDGSLVFEIEFEKDTTQNGNNNNNDISINFQNDNDKGTQTQDEPGCSDCDGTRDQSSSASSSSRDTTDYEDSDSSDRLSIGFGSSSSQSSVSSLQLGHKGPAVEPTSPFGNNELVLMKDSVINDPGIKQQPYDKEFEHEMNLLINSSDIPKEFPKMYLFVQMQLCQTSLQEYLKQRAMRIVSRPSDMGDSKCGSPLIGTTDHDRLIDPVQNMRIFRAIVEGVQYIHENRLIHRDIKPANIFLDIRFEENEDRLPSTNASTRKGTGNNLSDFSSSIKGTGGYVSDTVMPSGFNSNRDFAYAAGSVKRVVDWDKVFGEPVYTPSKYKNKGVSSPDTPSISLRSSFPGNSDGQPLAKHHHNHHGHHQHSNNNNKRSSICDLPYLCGSIYHRVNIKPMIGDFGLVTACCGSPEPANDSNSTSNDSPNFCDPNSGGDYHYHRNNSEYDGVNMLPKPSSLAIRRQKGHQRQSPSVCLPDVPYRKHTSNVGTVTYAAPEQLSSESTEYDEKADIYSLGIILFELYYPFHTQMERVQTLKELRDGILPQDFVTQWPKEAATVLNLTAKDPQGRPTAKSILEMGLFEVDAVEYEELRNENQALKMMISGYQKKIEELETKVSALQGFLDESVRSNEVKTRQK